MMHRRLYTEDSKKMRGKTISVLKTVIFCFLVAVIVVRTGNILTLKGKEYLAYYSSVQHSEFYEMEKDTVDVLFLGTSHSYCGFSPQEFYDRCGIRSYNLGTSRQSIWLSYYWLKEALKTQKPKIVVQELYYAGGSNENEASVQKGLSFMKWSRNKAEAVSTAVEEYPELSFKSFIFPNMRFHGRWNELTAEDFPLPEIRDTGALKGYAPTLERLGETEYKLIREADDGKKNDEGSGFEYWPETAEEAQWPDLSKEYMDKITALCKEKGITLVLVKTPSARGWSMEDHNAAKSYARENGLAFYDLNTLKYYKAMNYDISVDNKDEGHANIWGAAKIADLLGNLLISEQNAPSIKDKQWEETAAYSEKIKKEIGLIYIDNAEMYLKTLSEGDYDIFVSVKGSTSEMKENLKEAMREIGFSKPMDEYYTAACDMRNAVKQEDAGEKEALVEGTVHNGLIGYKITSGYDQEEAASILIDGEEYSLNREGVNIVVYSKTFQTVLDSVCLSSDHDYELQR